MNEITGGCHCGAVRFNAQSTLDKIILCNCSLCAKKGMIHHQLAPENFRLTAGADKISLYQFGTKTARHLFCPNCGIHVYSNPRSAPDRVSLNMRCVDGFDLDGFSGEVIRFDGVHWEESVEGLREKMACRRPPPGFD